MLGSTEDSLYGIPQGLDVILIFLNHVTIEFDFRTFQEAVEMVHCGCIPTMIYGRVVPLPLLFEFAFASLCCQNLTVYESIVDMLLNFAFMYRWWSDMLSFT